jgi:hypothetical protein
MACGHGDREACCCMAGGTSASIRRCAPGDGGFVPAPVTRVVLPPMAGATAAPPLSGWLAVVFAAFALRLRPNPPEPVPKPLS